MIQGFERREVQQQQAIGLTSPAQLGQMGIQQPRGGSVKGVGNGSVFSDLLSLGVAEVDAAVERKRARDEVDLEMLYHQGKSEQDAIAAGFNPNITEKVYQSLNFKAGHNEWFAQASVDAENMYAGVSPDQYREHLSAQFGELLSTLPKDDKAAIELARAVSSASFDKLVARHTVVHKQYLQNQTQSSLYKALTTQSMSPDTEDMARTLDTLTQFEKELGKAPTNAAVKSAVIDTLREGSLNLYDSLGGKTGLLDRGFSPTDISSVTNALDAAYRQRNASTASARMDEEISLAKAYAERRLSEEDLQKGYQSIEDTYKLDPAYSDTMLLNAVSTMQKNNLAQEDAIKMADPVFRGAINEVLTDIMATGDLTGKIERIQSIGAAHDLRAEQVTALVQDAVKEQEVFEQDRRTAQRKTIRDFNTQVATAEKAKQLAVLPANQWDRYTTDDKVMQAAFKAIEQDASFIAEQQFQASGATGDSRQVVLETSANAVAGAAVRTTAVYKELQRTFELAGQITDPVDANATINPRIEEAWAFWKGLRSAGASESLLDTYAGPAADVMRLLESSSYTPEAVAQAYRALNTPVDKPIDIAPLMKKWDAFLSPLTKSSNDLVNSVKPLIPLLKTGEDPGTPTSDIDNIQARKAAEEPEVRAAFQKMLTDYARLYPNRDANAVYKLAANKFIKQTEFIGGSFLPPKDGMSMTDRLGLREYVDGLDLDRQPLVIDAALREAIRSTPELHALTTVKSADRGLISRIAAVPGEAIAEATKSVFGTQDSTKYYNISTQQLSGTKVVVTFYDDVNRHNIVDSRILDLQDVMDEYRTKFPDKFSGPVGTK